MEFRFNLVSCILPDNPIPKGDLKQQIMPRRDSKSVGSMNSIPMLKTGGSNFIQKYESPTRECSTLGGKWPWESQMWAFTPRSKWQNGELFHSFMDLILGEGICCLWPAINTRGREKHSLDMVYPRHPPHQVTHNSFQDDTLIYLNKINHFQLSHYLDGNRNAHADADTEIVKG